MSLANLLEYLMPADDSPTAIRNYRLRMGLVACSAWLGLYLVIFQALLWPVPFIGQIARASEVDDKIKDAMQPVQAQLGQITTQIAQQDATLTAIRVDQIETKLRDLQRLLCEDGDDRARGALEREIEAAQREHRKLTGERYPLPVCKP